MTFLLSVIFPCVVSRVLSSDWCVTEGLAGSRSLFSPADDLPCKSSVMNRFGIYAPSLLIDWDADGCLQIGQGPISFGERFGEFTLRVDKPTLLD